MSGEYRQHCAPRLAGVAADEALQLRVQLDAVLGQVLVQRLRAQHLRLGQEGRLSHNCCALGLVVCKTSARSHPWPANGAVPMRAALARASGMAGSLLLSTCDATLTQ